MEMSAKQMGKQAMVRRKPWSPSARPCASGLITSSQASADSCCPTALGAILIVPLGNHSARLWPIFLPLTHLGHVVSWRKVGLYALLCCCMRNPITIGFRMLTSAGACTDQLPWSVSCYVGIAPSRTPKFLGLAAQSARNRPFVAPDLSLHIARSSWRVGGEETDIVPKLPWLDMTHFFALVGFCLI